MQTKATTPGRKGISSLEDVKERILGKIGEPGRDKYEEEMQAVILAELSSPIETEEDYEKRLITLDLLLDKNPPEGSTEYFQLDALSREIEKYEAVHYPIPEAESGESPDKK